MFGRLLLERALGHGGARELALCRAILPGLLLATGGGPTICLPLFLRKVLKCVAPPTRLRAAAEGLVVMAGAAVGTVYYAVLDKVVFDQFRAFAGSASFAAGILVLIVPCQVDCYWRLFRLGAKQLCGPRTGGSRSRAPALAAPPPPPLPVDFKKLQ